MGGALVRADGMLFTTRTGRLNVIRPDGAIEFFSSDDTYCHPNNRWTSLALSDDGVLYVNSETGLNAIQTNSKGLAGSSWPKTGCGRKNAYRYGAP
jgi:hypothetical protein